MIFVVLYELTTNMIYEKYKLFPKSIMRCYHCKMSYISVSYGVALQMNHNIPHVTTSWT